MGGRRGQDDTAPTLGDSTSARSAFPSAGGQFVISLDFELYWGVRDLHTIAEYRSNMLGVWDVVPRMLSMFHAHGIRATWATVGFLMAMDRDELFRFAPSVRPSYVDSSLDPYRDLHEIGRDENDDPYHFAPSLVKLIASTPGQEVATHTLSHFYPLEESDPDGALRADLESALALGKSRDLTLTSVVFPRNQVTPRALRISNEIGLTAFRGTERACYQRPHRGPYAPVAARALRLIDAYVPLGTHHLAAAEKVEGMVNVPASRFLRPWRSSLARLEPLRIQRMLAAMSHAAVRGEVFHLWWHPHNFGVDQEQNLHVLQRILEHYEELHATHGLRSASMCDVAGAVRRRTR